PGLRVLLAHGGGALPAVRGRPRPAFAGRDEARARSAAGPDETLRRVYYDTVTHDRGPLPDPIRYAGAGPRPLRSARPLGLGTDDPADEVRALALGAGEALVLGDSAAVLLGVAGDLRK